MKKTILLGIIYSVFTLVITMSCKKDEPTTQQIIANGVTDGESATISDETISETINLQGGDIVVSGNSQIISDINVQNDNSSLLITDNSQVEKVNMSAGELRFEGSPTIETDLNINNGKVYIGSSDSKSTDTVRIMNNCNLFDSLFVNGGVLVIEKDFNQNGFVNIANGAKVIVKHDMNKGADLYGGKGLDVVGNFNINSGILNPEPKQ